MTPHVAPDPEQHSAKLPAQSLTQSTLPKLRSWTCPFASNTIHTISRKPLDARPTPTTLPAFIATATEEARHVPVLKAGFTSYLTALQRHRPFSASFFSAEQAAIATACLQLDHLAYLLRAAVASVVVVNVPGATGSVPAALAAEVDNVRAWIGRHRASLVACHVFFKINFTLAHGPQCPSGDVVVERATNGIGTASTGVVAPVTGIQAYTNSIRVHRRGIMEHTNGLVAHLPVLAAEAEEQQLTLTVSVLADQGEVRRAEGVVRVMEERLGSGTVAEQAEFIEAVCWLE